LCEAQGLELVEDKGLLAELAGLAEWPVVMMGAFDPKFLELPDEALSASMRGHQKYFSVRDPKAGRLAAKFVYVANLEAEDGGRSMRAGYERVLTARLSDAWYLYHQDLKRSLEDRVGDLDRVTFFEGLGSIGDKARRVAALAREIAPKVGANPAEAESAALLAKADLTTGMVYEFPELQGLMGRYYALKQEVTENIADAIRDHYLPKGADDDAPSAPVSVAVALADKLDTLAAFFAIDKKPTGSSDPFALRRAALGTIAVTIAGNVRIKLGDIFAFCAATFFDQANNQEMDLEFRNFEGYFGRVTDFNPDEIDDIYLTALRNLDSNGKLEIERARVYASYHRSIGTELIAFFHDRLKVYLKDRGHRHDRIDAVLRRADGEAEDDIALIVMKLKALNAFLDSDDGANLAAGYKRAANILKAEEKKGAAAGAVDAALLQQAEEKALFAALGSAEARADEAARAERFADAMAALAALRAPIDAFFDKVTVNAEEASLRANRLALLRRFVTATARVADLSKLEG
jgi:glycyl-tRNA synthetase beta chain